MHLSTVAITNFRRLKDVTVDLESETTIFVGANNSGKTSAASALRLLIKGRAKDIAVFDFSASCLESLRSHDGEGKELQPLPAIGLDLWFDVTAGELHRVVGILPSLDWVDQPVGIRLKFGPRDEPALLERYRTAKETAMSKTDGTYHPWPATLQEYLEKKLHSEYELTYFVLEQADSNPASAHPMQNSRGEAATTLDDLLTIDFLDAQRFLSDSEANARTQDLSRSLSHFYQRNLDQFETDTSVLQALHDSEESFNTHLEQVFRTTLRELNTLGYPGIENPDLVIRSNFSPKQIMAQDTAVRYSLPRAEGDLLGIHLPEKYNGLGFKNLIYMVIQILDFHQRWAAQEFRTPVHLVVVEEPEAHLHAQLQQVFIAKMRDIISDGSGLTTQLIVTTHSAHVINESHFTPIRYFRRLQSVTGRHESQVRDVSKMEAFDSGTKDFLARYMKLTHCDLFFADAVILVEGNVERLLLPSIIEKVQPSLTSNYLTILEVGGAFAHKFDPLLALLGIPALVITDLDSVTPREKKDDSKEPDADTSSAAVGGSRCRADSALAVTSNATLSTWHPHKSSVKELLALADDNKVMSLGSDCPTLVRVAYQTTSRITWAGASAPVTGRTFEEAFAFENLDWVLHEDQRTLLSLVSSRFDPSTSTLDEIVQEIHTRVKGAKFKKTELALSLMLSSGQWQAPHYIAQGLAWLADVLSPLKIGATK